MGIVLVFAVAVIVWVYLNRERRILRAAQPQFLYILAFGAMVSVSTVLVISFDESRGWSENALGRACMAIPWLLSLGHIITYGALFAKLWRINKVLQFTRRKIGVKPVVWPVAALAVSALVCGQGSIPSKPSMIYLSLMVGGVVGSPLLLINSFQRHGSSMPRAMTRDSCLGSVK